jgi:hypothetical protein
LESNDRIAGLVLGAQQHQPHVAAFVVDDEQKWLIFVGRLQRDRPT